ncbi:MAG: nucleoside hydrolase, partial [Tepidiformaceae bacterium]
DDLCALALVLAAPDVEVVGITTVADRDCRRAAFARHALKLAGAGDIPVASGAFSFLGGEPHELVLQDERYWPGLVATRPGAAGAAFDLLHANAAAGATVIAIGPYTNLALLEVMRPGAFNAADLVVMGGNIAPPGPGLPPWGPAMDYNVQADRVAARIVFERLRPLIVPLEATVKTWLCQSNLPRLRRGGQLAQLMADQAELYAKDTGIADQVAANPALPRDLLNYQHDPFACAAALDWECFTAREFRLAVTEQDGQLALVEDADGRELRVVTGVDSRAFSARWLDVVAGLASR